MGVSSERVGHTGPGQEATDGLRDVAPHERDPDADTPPEQSAGNPEDNPEGLPPKAGYPSQDPAPTTRLAATIGSRRQRPGGLSAGG